MKKLVLMVVIIITTACSSTIDYSGNLVPAYRTISPGTILTVNTPLTIEPQLARVYFQNGAIQAESDLNKYYPNCSLEIKTLSSSKQTILPDRFVIIKIKTMSDPYTSLPYRYAGLIYNDYVPSDENWITSFYLQSAKQPDVLRLNCQHWEDPANARHVTYDEIKKVLGEYITFNINN